MEQIANAKAPRGLADMADVLLEAIRYEHWLRFYFLDPGPESGPEADADAPDPAGAFPDAVLNVPADCAGRSRREEPHLAPLLDALQGRPLALERSRDCVFAHAAGQSGQSAEAAGEELFRLVGDPDFRRGLDAFHSWVQALADGEATVGGPAGPDSPDSPDGEAAPSFRVWQAAFKEWERTCAVRFINNLPAYAPDL